MPKYFRYKKFTDLSVEKMKKLTYKDIGTLQRFITETGRIIPSRITGVTPRCQREITKSIKIARFLALLPYTDQHK